MNRYLKAFWAREIRAAASEYQQFMHEHPEKHGEMEVWESAPLVDEPSPRNPDLGTANPH